MEALTTHSEPTGKRQATVQALKDKGLTRLDWRDIFKVGAPDELKESDHKAMDEYFSQFLAPGPCPMCGSALTGDIMKQFIGLATFTWGLANGEGFCSKCKYPARAYHRNVGPIEFLNLVLCYHPGELTEKASLSNSAGSSQGDSISGAAESLPNELA